MPGSSFFRIIRKQNVFSITGPTGPTGTTGPTGPIGYGPTGPTGLGISGISLVGVSLRTQFDDLSFYSTQNGLYGPKGDSVTPVKVQVSATGASIVSSQPSSNEIVFRSLKGKTSSSQRSELKITDLGNTLSIEYIANTNGLTLVNLGIDALSSFVGTTGTGLSLTNIRTSNYTPSNGAGVLMVRNVIEKARGLGFTGATNSVSGITCNYSYNDLMEDYFPCKTVVIDPACVAKNSIDYGTTNKTYVVDMENNLGKVIIGRPISPTNTSAFTLVVKNGQNSIIGYEKRFQSPYNQISWPFGVEPCFGGTGETDVYHFYSLFDSWFGSVVYSSKYAGKTFGCVRSDTLKFGACCEKYFVGGTCGITCSIKLEEQCNGINQIFRGVGSTCGTNACTATGPCCVRIGCNTPFETVVQCFEGITFENCLCGTFNTDLGDCVHPATPTESSGVEFTFHYGYTACFEIDDCNLTTCPRLGSCCIEGTCIDNAGEGISREDCEAQNGHFIEGELCGAVGSNYCTLGRCCRINYNDLKSSTCEITTEANCYTTASNIGVTWMAGGNCEDNKCLFVGACCTGGDCIYPTYELNSSLSSLYSNIVGPSTINPICIRGLCGSFMGEVCCNDGSFTCDDPATYSQTGTCVRLTCPDGSPIIQQTTLAQCMNYANSRFYANSTPSTTGQCCTRILIDDFPIETYCYNTTLSDCMLTGGYNGGGWRCTVNDTVYDAAFYPSQTCSQSECSYPDASTTQDASVESIYVGEYTPKGTNLLGKNFKICCPTTFDDMMVGTEVLAKSYDSKFDWAGYGVTFAKNSDPIANNIKFKVFVYSKDLSYTDGQGNNVVSVKWGQSNGKQAWGPHYQLESQIYVLRDLKATTDSTTTEYSWWDTLAEGYWLSKNSSGVTLTTEEMLMDYSFNKQADYFYKNSISALTDLNYSCISNNGAWRRNWGLYNTMRMIGADNEYTINSTPEYELDGSWTAPRLVADLNRTIGVNSNSSSWFIPSMDEMAFICEKLPSINNLLEEEMSGKYWTSTGAFNYDVDKTEGVYTLSDPPTSPKCGSAAWSFDIQKNIGGMEQQDSFTIKVKKETRSSLLKVRPIRIEIEDTTQIPAQGTESYKLWRLSPLKWLQDNYPLT